MADALPGTNTGKKIEPAAVHSDKSLIVRIQTDYLKYERELDLANLQEKQEQERIERQRRRVRSAVLLSVALVLAAAGTGLAFLISDAVNSSEVVVEPFHTPLALTASGIDGTVVARHLLDELTRLQRATRGMAARRGVQSAWANGVRLAAPTGHFALDAITAMLKARYGHGLHVSGDLAGTGADELALTVRAEGIATRTLSGTTSDLSSLTKEAAEYVFGQSEPGLWASQLSAEGRYAETIQYAQAAFPTAARADKPYLLNAWGVAMEPTGASPREALALYRAALKLKPDYWNAWTNVQSASINLGDEEDAWQAGERMLKLAGGRPGRAPEADYQSWDLITWNLLALLNGQISDPEAYGGVGSMISAAGTTIADIQARLHDLRAAELAPPTSRSDPTDPGIGAMSNLARARLAAEAGDMPRAVAELQAYGAASANPATANEVARDNCWIAVVYEAAGHPDQADAILASAGTFVDCYRFRADILDGRGDWAGAQKAYRAAVKLAPDLPAGYYSWGLALARHGDLVGAAEKFRDANMRGPRWADPLKAWGDVLVQQGHAKEANGKYREALKYAPNWAELKKVATGAQRVS